MDSVETCICLVSALPLSDLRLHAENIDLKYFLICNLII